MIHASGKCPLYAKRRLGTIQSSRPGYGALMPQDSLYGKPPRDFQKVEARKTRNLFMN
ncbi:hypothetical protein MES4922_450004 [Mesorhizobium ventifaucium]|uniref:Uncharacterized protein n=1 Tax=Mesorhizobium ventifaucium TaxID=666020 RepID=A0ABN8KBM3_9HYPH|nr:hypothetical protein MES4922_450004 [Mesorhizobium ventifaucium]